MHILVTGTAGFIGFHLAKRLLKDGHQVIGVDNINDYYDIDLKYDRLVETGIDRRAVHVGDKTASSKYDGYIFYKAQLEDKEILSGIFRAHKIDAVVNLAAQAGVRYSLTNPDTYIQSNIVGFTNILECCRHHHVGHLVYASSSSVYGLNEEIPFSTNENVDHPVSLYAASKKSNELMAHVYSHLFGIPSTGLRFFTVYGPWGRPDMALFLFTKAMLEGRPIQVFNNGHLQRDFTYIDDIVEGIVRVLHHVPQPNSNWHSGSSPVSESSAPYKVYNIGNSAPVQLMDFIQAIEAELGIEAVKEFLPMQPGDVPSTYADVSDLNQDTGYKPSTSVRDGIKNFIAWYRGYYNIR